MKNKNVICPYCGQDWIWRVALRDKEPMSYANAFCYECDTFWENGEEISDRTGLTFKLFMEKKEQRLDYKLIRKGPKLEIPFD